MFGIFKGKAKEAVNQFSGNKDFLEGLCAIVVLVAAADGSISDAEVEAGLKSIKTNAAISASFSVTEIESVFGKLVTKADNRAGRMALKTEIREVVARDKTGQMAQALILTGLDVADQGGGIDPKEADVLKSIATEIGVNYEKLANG